MPAEQLTYTNPVYDGYFADPFVLFHDGTYYAVGTGEHEASDASTGHAGTATDEFVIPMLASDDLVHWQSLGQVLRRPDPSLGGEFWAPALAHADGTFFLYYSLGPRHQLRVATSNLPQGPYRDTDEPLTEPSFAIDPHPYRDDDGRWFLFYARDFLDCEQGCRAGTALVVDRLIDMRRLAGEERVVLRAHHDWQRFQADRPMYGKIWDWHTLEGPCVAKHEGRYYCFYSGGCYRNETYGVDYAVAERIDGPYSETGNFGRPRLLTTIPGRVSGPGHNSLLIAPDGETEFLVYHAWNASGTKRQMCLDRLRWTPGGPRCAGPTWAPQTMPAAANAFYL